MYLSEVIVSSADISESPERRSDELCVAALQGREDDVNDTRADGQADLLVVAVRQIAHCPQGVVTHLLVLQGE